MSDQCRGDGPSLVTGAVVEGARLLPPGPHSEVMIDDELVAALLSEQFPMWAGLPRFEVHAFGTVHAIYRLGEDLAVRLPRIAGAEGALDKELALLPELGRALALEVPVPLATGAPSDAFPFHWQVTTWVEGETIPFARLADPIDDARGLGRFVRQLHGLDTTGGPAPGQHNSWRGAPLSSRDDQTRRAIMRLGGELNLELALATWDAALEADEDATRGAWIHGDLLPTNLVSRCRRLAGVIDFGCMCVGDPACDVMAAWTALGGRRDLDEGSRLGAVVRRDRAAALHGHQPGARGDRAPRDPRGP